MTERDHTSDRERQEAARKQEIKYLEENIAVLIAEKGVAHTLALIVHDPRMFRFRNMD